jgi:hypothetical protein
MLGTEMRRFSLLPGFGMRVIRGADGRWFIFKPFAIRSFCILVKLALPSGPAEAFPLLSWVT